MKHILAKNQIQNTGHNILTTMKDYFKAIPAVYVIMQKEGMILLLRRWHMGYCDGMYGLPSGHVEAGESIVQGMMREVREEVGVRIRPEQLTLVHLRSRNALDGHRLDHFFLATAWDQEPQNKEPAKCDDLAWFSLDALPSTIYAKHPSEKMSVASAAFKRSCRMDRWASLTLARFIVRRESDAPVGGRGERVGWGPR